MGAGTPSGAEERGNLSVARKSALKGGEGGGGGENKRKEKGCRELLAECAAEYRGRRVHRHGRPKNGGIGWGEWMGDAV